MSERIPEGWKTAQLRDCLASKPQYGANTPAKSFSHDLVRYIRITDIDGRGNLIESEKRSISQNDASEYLLNRDDILIARSGNTVGKSYMHKATSEPSAYAGYLIRFITNPQSLRPDYLFQYTQSPQYDRWILGILRAGAQPNINATEYGDLELSLPPTPEQQKIASILTSVDEVIERTKGQISKLQDLKKGMMQELLTKGIGHTEFKDSPVGRIPKEWDVVGIYDACQEIFLGLTSKVDYVETNGVPLVRATDIAGGILSFNKAKQISKEQHLSLTKYRKAKRGDVLVSKSGSLGVCALVETDREFSIYESIIVLQPKTAEISSILLLWLMRASETQRRLLGGTVGSTVGHLNLGDFRKLKIPLPSIDEQNNIALMLEAIDKKRVHAKNILWNLKGLKKALMQDLLTGKVRVKVH